MDCFLVIDDDKIFREASCLLIEDDGHYAASAANAEIALTLLAEQKFDAVLLDLNLGGDNGLAVLPRILKICPNLPVVMFSAQGSVETAVQAIRLGAVDFLEKPFTRDQFHAVLARLQKISQMGRQIESLEQAVKDKQDPERRNLALRLCHPADARRHGRHPAAGGQDAPLLES